MVTKSKTDPLDRVFGERDTRLDKIIELLEEQNDILEEQTEKINILAKAMLASIETKSIKSAKPIASIKKVKNKD